MQYGGNRGWNRGGSSGGMSGGSSFSPVKVGEELDVTIEAVGEKGDGVAKKKGFVIFVPGVQQGDNVRIRITKVFRKMAFAEVIGQAEGPVESDSEQDEEMPAEEEQESASEEDEEPAQDVAEDSEEF